MSEIVLKIEGIETLNSKLDGITAALLSLMEHGANINSIQQPQELVQATTPQAPIQQTTTPQAPIQQPTTPNPVPVKMPDNLAPAVSQFIGQQPPVQAPQSVPTTAPQTPVQAPQPVAPTEPTQQVPQAPVQAPQAPQAPVQTQILTYTQQDLALAATQLMDSGKQADVLNLIASFGVQALTQLPQEQFGNFATALRTLGAKI